MHLSASVYTQAALFDQVLSYSSLCTLNNREKRLHTSLHILGQRLHRTLRTLLSLHIRPHDGMCVPVPINEDRNASLPIIFAAQRGTPLVRADGYVRGDDHLAIRRLIVADEEGDVL